MKFFGWKQGRNGRPSGVPVAPRIEGSGKRITLGFARPLLGRLLVETGRLTEAQLLEALELHQSAGLRVGEALLKLGYCTDEDVAAALAQQNEMPFVSLQETPSPALLRQIPAQVARRLGVVPAGQDSLGRLIVVARNPLDFHLDGRLRAATGLPTVIAWGVEKRIDRILAQYSELSRWAVRREA